MKILRVLRVLRPLRAINRAKGLKVCSAISLYAILLRLISSNCLACSSVRYRGCENNWQYCAGNVSAAIHVCRDRSAAL